MQTRQIPEIVRKNVKSVISILMDKGLEYEQSLINQYLNGQKSQYQFLLPKSKNYRYYIQQLSYQIDNQKRQRKLPNIEQQNYQKDNESLIVIGSIQQVSVGAMCQLIKELRQNKQPYEPYQNQIYEHEIVMNLNNQYLEKKVQSIFDQALALTTPNKIVEKKDPQQKLNIQNKTEFLRSQFGTERDGSLGAWGGKKYEGLGMRDQFTNYRKQISKNFYSQGNSIR